MIGVVGRREVVKGKGQQDREIFQEISQGRPKTLSLSRDRPLVRSHNSSGASLPQTPDALSPGLAGGTIIGRLQQEEERIRHEEELEVDRKRQAAANWQRREGFTLEKRAEESISETKIDSPVVEDIPAPTSSEIETVEVPLEASDDGAAEAAGADPETHSTEVLNPQVVADDLRNLQGTILYQPGCHISVDLSILVLS